MSEDLGYLRSARGELVNHLAYYRRQLNMTQPQLAEVSGVARETISNIERGLSAPGVEVAICLAQALNQPVEALFMVPRLEEAQPTLRELIKQYGRECVLSPTEASRTREKIEQRLNDAGLL